MYLQPDDLEDVLPLCFLGISLSREEKKFMQKCATMLHAKVVEDYSSEGIQNIYLTVVSLFP